MGQIYAIYRNTFLETVRQPVYGLILMIGCAVIAMSPATGMQIYTFGTGSGLEKTETRMIADLGLGTALLAGLLLAVFCTASVISREIDEKTALTILSKRISRTAFVFGKYFGVSTAIAAAAAVMTAYLLMTIRVGAPVAVRDKLDWKAALAMIAVALAAVIFATARNYFRGRPWVGSFTLFFIPAVLALFLVYGLFDRDYSLVLRPDGVGYFGAYDMEVAKAGLLTLEAILVVAGVAVAASTRLGMGGNFAVSACAYLGGMTTEYFLDAYGYLPPVQAFCRLLPNLQTFWMSDALTREETIPLAYVGTASLYAVGYIFAMLFLAAFLFEKREIA